MGVFSTLTVDGWIHSVPIHYLVRGDELRIVVLGSHGASGKGTAVAVDGWIVR